MVSGTIGHDDKASWDQRIYPRGRDKDEEHLIFTIGKGFGATLSWLAADGTDLEQTDGMVATESIKLLESYASDKQPFFLAVGFYKPHTPYVAPKKYFEMYDPAEIGVPRIPADYFSTLPIPAVKTLTKKKDQVNLPESTKREAMHAYYATITFMDAQVGRVIEALEELGLMDNTVIVFSSDHGYHMGEHAHIPKADPVRRRWQGPVDPLRPGNESTRKANGIASRDD